jgi:hypothetical protein
MYVIIQNQNNIYWAPCCYALLMMINIAMQLELNSYFIEFYFNLTNFVRNCVHENLNAL